jgi:hypothetical protein
MSPASKCTVEHRRSARLFRKRAEVGQAYGGKLLLVVSSCVESWWKESCGVIGSESRKSDQLERRDPKAVSVTDSTDKILHTFENPSLECCRYVCLGPHRITCLVHKSKMTDADGPSDQQRPKAV